ncbi:glyoxylate/hydroxypyruvate reductase A [Variovorax sp. J22G73]|uniref:2-hydroxyacid dehydrogenase n=1 Tax=unclassified Variovorax TaxID=663243 RepID=UPI0025763EA9|nr:MULTISPECIES: glyoxylate/hydroxypyruvate reductase A [unclassified Variovorax]MDM0010006.1 glyoxylate/hydroxypyruvate reductase A [Variovorax sp. J22R203]MDM0102514.1 glyoxylate/hydroxypyruvate reductase A [Variovorax sp. J22G73]
MTRIALISQSANLGYFAPLVQAVAPELEVVVWPDPGFREADVAMCWNAPAGVYAQMPKLRLVHSIAAGVDNVVAGQDLRGLPVCRVVDPKLADGMVQYVLWSVLHFHRRFDVALANQRQRVWQRPQQTPAGECRVGLMGLGKLGGAIARSLLGLGYAVNGWSRSAHAIEGMAMYGGAEALDDFLGATDVLVCVLPLTEATRGILGRRTFDALPRGAAVVNCGRGEHLVAADLLAALGSGQVRGAVLDVFASEPLPAEDPLWQAPGVIVTPHMATMASSAVVARQVVDNVRRLDAGEPLLNVVDMHRGY